MAMHPEGMGRYYALADTSYYTTFSPVQKPTVRPARPFSDTMLNIEKYSIREEYTTFQRKLLSCRGLVSAGRFRRRVPLNRQHTGRGTFMGSLLFCGYSVGDGARS